jgi:spermidine synthase
LLGETRTPQDAHIRLMRRGGEYVILVNGKSLMSSRMHGSEEALTTLACRRARMLAAPCVLVGGLGMGFTLRATLDLLPQDATVVVAELLPAVVVTCRLSSDHSLLENGAGWLID